MNFNEYSVDELKAMRDEINSTIKVKRAEEREAEKKARAERAEKMRENLQDGDRVRFLFDGGKVEGEVLRRSEKTVTVKFEKDGEEVEKYRDYGLILEILQ